MLSNEICSIFFAVNTFSHRAEFLWPPGCNHLMLPSWQIETCPLDHPEECRRDSLREQRNGGTYLYMYTEVSQPSKKLGALELDAFC